MGLIKGILNFLKDAIVFLFSTIVKIFTKWYMRWIAYAICAYLVVYLLLSLLFRLVKKKQDIIDERAKRARRRREQREKARRDAPIRNYWSTAVEMKNEFPQTYHRKRYITKNEFQRLVRSTVRDFNCYRLDLIAIDEARLIFEVESKSGASIWGFTINYDDDGRISGRYVFESENEDSEIPRALAKNIKKAIKRTFRGKR